MAIPIADENPTHKNHKSYITIGLIAINVVVYLFFQGGIFAEVDPIITIGFGLIPSVLWGNNYIDETIFSIAADLTLISYMFLHGGLMHMVSNMLILWVFGDNIELALGRAQYLLFYILGGVAAALLQAIMLMDSELTLEGASGA
ncbi:MAG: rhomboid family intramembrane serine protease, partial [Rhizobiales bacterium]|nr:rhomboid family intramembrane serine protease [Hyphomicrobiales bacterium]